MLSHVFGAKCSLAVAQSSAQYSHLRSHMSTGLERHSILGHHATTFDVLSARGTKYVGRTLCRGRYVHVIIPGRPQTNGVEGQPVYRLSNSSQGRWNSVTVQSREIF